VTKLQKAKEIRGIKRRILEIFKKYDLLDGETLDFSEDVEIKEDDIVMGDINYSLAALNDTCSMFELSSPGDLAYNYKVEIKLDLVLEELNILILNYFLLSQPACSYISNQKDGSSDDVLLSKTVMTKVSSYKGRNNKKINTYIYNA
jgi:hypothetical protein